MILYVTTRVKSILITSRILQLLACLCDTISRLLGTASHNSHKPACKEGGQDYKVKNAIMVRMQERSLCLDLPWDSCVSCTEASLQDALSLLFSILLPVVNAVET